jgi:hypothetical protein
MADDQEKQKEDEKRFPEPKFEKQKTFKLCEPIEEAQMGGSSTKLTEITLRSPLVLDVFEVGGGVTRNVYTEEGMHIEAIQKNIKTYLVRLSGKSWDTLSQMQARDLKQMYRWLNQEISVISGN